ncbi:MAG: iron ABC transporter permease [Clostridiales Family XIII bacterium]|jgi:iron complex transport system permease protein|nr:iron ABC transporter permease [Clostridiales Family XIII bacterium]
MNEVFDTFSTKRQVRKICLLAVGLAVVALISFGLGRYFASPAAILQTVAAKLSGAEAADPKLAAALFNIRLPRIIIVILVGMGLSVAGASYQGMFKNPLVSPDLLGASAGASFGACLALLLNLGNEFIQLFAFTGGLAAVGLVMFINRIIRGDALLGLILAGILVGTLFTSGMTIIKSVADADDKLPAITFWLMGSFAGAERSDVLPLLIPMIAGFALVLTQGWNLNVLSFGEDEARTLGIHTGRTRTFVILGATLLTASSIAVAGVIGWIGLVVPHLTRSIVGPNYKILLPTTMLTGATFLLIVDNVARLLYSVEIPIGLLTSILGVPFFIFIYRKNLRGWS